MRRVLGYLALIVALAGCRGGRETGSVYVDPALLSLVPPGAVSLAGIRVDAFVKTPLYQRRLAQTPLPGLEEFAKATGVDPRRDVWQVLTASSAGSTVVLIRGKFSQGGAEPRLQIPGASRIPHKGYTITGVESFGVAFLNPCTAVAGKLDAVKWVLDSRDRSGPKPEMMEQLKSIPRNAHIWALSLGRAPTLPQKTPKNGNWVNVEKILASLRGIKAWADFSQGLTARVEGSAASEQEAKQLAAALKGLIGLGRLSTPDNKAELLRAFDALKVEQQGSALRLNASLDQNLAEQLVAFLQTAVPGR
jgi:hypothetical protein